MFQNLKNKIKNYFTVRLALVYGLITFAFLMWVFFIDDYSVRNQMKLQNEINKLQEEKDYYTQEINKDKQALKKLMQDDGIEKYAREKYYMKRDSEDIYIIEYKEIEKK